MSPSQNILATFKSTLQVSRYSTDNSLKTVPMLRSSQVKSSEEEKKINYYLLPVLDATGSFLTVSASEFISDLWNSYRTYL